MSAVAWTDINHVELLALLNAKYIGVYNRFGRAEEAKDDHSVKSLMSVGGAQDCELVGRGRCDGRRWGSGMGRGGLSPRVQDEPDTVYGKCRCDVRSVRRQEVWNDCMSCEVRISSNGNLLWEVSVLLGRKKGGVRVTCEDDHGVTKGREDVHEVFQRRGSEAKRKISRCGRNQMGNEPILAFPEGADDFVVYYDARSKDLEACLEKGRNMIWHYQKLCIILVL
ncbi:hypothetical protein Tco_1037467 [Tanacetum coccineum]